MSAGPGSLPRIPDYNLAEPSEPEVVAALARVFGPARAADAWAAACRKQRATVGAVSGVQQLARCAAALADEGGAYATVARSVAIRLSTYNRLAARAAATISAEATRHVNKS